MCRLDRHLYFVIIRYEELPFPVPARGQTNGDFMARMISSESLRSPRAVVAVSEAVRSPVCALPRLKRMEPRAPRSRFVIAQAEACGSGTPIDIRHSTFDNPASARAEARGSQRRPAFSLAELVVALGILVVMLALAGQVFNFTVQSTGQATALVEINQRLRALEQSLREDLRYVIPGQSLLLIQGNPVNAYWTEDQQLADNDGNPANGYPRIKDPDREFIQDNETLPLPPRADILMFFTSRRQQSYVDPSVTASVQQVVYGHAELGEYTPITQGGAGNDPAYQFRGILEEPIYPVDTTGYPDPVEVSRIPASRWHLARRNVLIAPQYRPRVDPPRNPNGTEEPSIIDSPVGKFDDLRVLRGMTDIIAHFRLTDTTQIQPFDYDNDVQRPARFDESMPAPQLDVFVGSWQLPRIFAFKRAPYARSQLDPNPPPAFAGRLGHYLMPHCASFKVEWTLDPKSSFVAGRMDGLTEVLWFDPGHVETHYDPDPSKDDPLKALADAIERAEDANDQELLNRLRNLLENRSTHPDGFRYSLADRFRSNAFQGTVSNPDLDVPWPPLSRIYGNEGRANMVAFTATRRVGDPEEDRNEFVPDDVFPNALRITVDVFDPQGRLERPIRHVMVIPVGQ
jgi:type II secretory pathway pseudopilin PulG